MDFKERVFLARKEKGLSQETLAESIGVSRQAVSKWETGEAMPDTEKLIALCRVLQLDMEYLALGKTVTPTATKGKKICPWIAALLVVVCLLSGFCIGFLWGRGSDNRQNIDLQTIKLLESVHVRNVTTSAAGSGELEIGILPSILPEGMTVQVFCEDQILGSAQTIPCTFSGNYYRFTVATYCKPFQYRMTVQLTVNGVNKQIPLIDIEGDAQSYSYVHRYSEEDPG